MTCQLSRVLLILALVLPLGAQISISSPPSSGRRVAEFLGNYTKPVELTLDTGSVTLPSGGGALTLDTQEDASTDNWTAMPCDAGDSFSVRAANDARSIVIVNSSIPTPTGANMTLDQDGDIALGICPTIDTPKIILFFDKDGKELYDSVDGGKTLIGTTRRPAGTIRLQASRVAGDVGSLTDGEDGELLIQESDNTLWYCKDDATDGCTKPSEYVAIVSGASNP